VLITPRVLRDRHIICRRRRGSRIWRTRQSPKSRLNNIYKIFPVCTALCSSTILIGRPLFCRLRALDAEHEIRKAVHHVLRHGGHTAGPSHVPEHRRAAEQILVSGDQTGEAGARLQAHRSHRDQSHIRRVLSVELDDRGRRDGVLHVRGLDVL